MTLENLKQALEKNIDKLADIMALQSTEDETDTAELVEKLKADIRTLNILIAAEKFPTPVSISNTLGTEQVAKLETRIAELQEYIVTDQNFDWGISMANYLRGTVDELKRTPG